MSRQRGFTLVEMLVSILILAIGLVGGALCLSLALTSNQRANRIALATEIAQSEIESQRSLGDLSDKTIDLKELDPRYERLMPKGRLVARVIGDNDEIDSEQIDLRGADLGQLNMKLLTVTVSWTGQHGTDSVKVDTLVFKREKHMGG